MAGKIEREAEAGQDENAGLVGLIRKSGVSVTGKVTSRLGELIFRILAAQVLGASLYGLYAVGWSAARILRTVGLAGLHRAGIKYIAANDAEGETAFVRGLIRLLTLLTIATTLVAGGSVIVFADIISGLLNKSELTSTIQTFGVVGICWALTALFVAMFRARGQIVIEQLLDNIRLYILFILVLGISASGASYDGVLTATAAASIVGVCIAGGTVLATFRPDQSVKTPPIKPLLKLAAPLFLAGGAYILLTRIDQFFLIRARSAATVGYYDAAVLVATQLSFLFTAVAAVTEPYISGMYHTGRKFELEVFLQTVTRLLTILTVPAAVALWFFAPLLLRLFGESFTTAAPVVGILALHHIVRVVIGPTGELLQMTGHERVLLLDMVGMLALNIVLNLILVPPFGAIGAAVATTISLVGIEVLSLIQASRLTGISPVSRDLVRPILLSSAGLLVGISTILAYGRTLTTAALLMLVGGLYAGITLSHIISDQDKDLLTDLV